VDVQRFRPDAAARASTRAELNIPSEAMVFVFVGRLSADKGVIDLARAFESLARAERNVYLVLVGPDEDGLEAAIRAAAAEAGARLRLVGMADAPQRYLAAGDVFCLPSYREGFGSAVIEAAAAGLPAIGTRIYGIVDAIEDGVTGLLVPAGDTAALTAAMLRLARDERARRALGGAARARALSDFSQEDLTSAVMAFYERVLPDRGPRA
jgi:glycosyltransferase involved in cell wall biosynthesis